MRCGTATTAAAYDGTWRRLQNLWAQSTDGTRRRVHSPSWATRSSVTSLTAVRGSTNPSTPLRADTNSSRCDSSAASDARTRVDPVRAALRAGARIRVVVPLRNRSNNPMPLVCPARGRDGGRPVWTRLAEVQGWVGSQENSDGVEGPAWRPSSTYSFSGQGRAGTPVRCERRSWA